MIRMLASVNSLDEAKIVLAAKVDIIDLKEPAMGSLGALDLRLVSQIVESINGQCPISATIGDLPMQPELIFNAVKEMAETSVNYIKIGFFQSENEDNVIEKLTGLSSDVNLVAVLFADNIVNFDIVEKLKVAGFKGVMLDTFDKSKGPLTRIITKIEIERFVSHVKSRHLICGLAGSLKFEDIPVLMPYQPDYLGFRGALCLQHERTGRLNNRSVQAIKQIISEFPC